MDQIELLNHLQSYINPIQLYANYLYYNQIINK